MTFRCRGRLCAKTSSKCLSDFKTNLFREARLQEPADFERLLQILFQHSAPHEPEIAHSPRNSGRFSGLFRNLRRQVAERLPAKQFNYL